jgi:hypothetical protein
LLSSKTTLGPIVAGDLEGEAVGEEEGALEGEDVGFFEGDYSRERERYRCEM